MRWPVVRVVPPDVRADSRPGGEHLDGDAGRANRVDHVELRAGRKADLAQAVGDDAGKGGAGVGGPWVGGESVRKLVKMVLACAADVGYVGRLHGRQGLCEGVRRKIGEGM